MTAGEQERQLNTSASEVQRTEQQVKPPDGGWGWVVVAATFISHGIADGVLSTFGILLVEFQETFGGGKGDTAWVMSLCLAFHLIIGPLVSASVNRFGCRPVCIAGANVAAVALVCASFVDNIFLLYVFLGIIAGIGIAFVILPTIVCVGNYFEKKRAFAIGISVAGSGIGTFMFAPIVRILIDTYGWRGSLLIEAGILLNIAICGALLRPLSTRKRIKTIVDTELDVISDVNSTRIEKENGGCLSGDSEFIATDQRTKENNIYQQSDGHKTSKPSSILNAIGRHFEFKLLKIPEFSIYAVSNISIAIAFNAPYTYLPDRAEENGLSKLNSAFLISVIGITNTIGRVLFGWISDRQYVSRIALYGIAVFICGIDNLINPLNHSYPFLITYSTVLGLFMSVYVSLPPAILVDLLGLERLNHALGLLMMFQGIGILVGLPTIGWFYDVTGDYSVPFYVIGSLFVFGALLLTLIPICVSSTSKHNNMMQIKPDKLSQIKSLSYIKKCWFYDVTGDYSVPFYVIGSLFVFGALLLTLIPICVSSTSKHNNMMQIKPDKLSQIKSLSYIKKCMVHHT